MSPGPRADLRPERRSVWNDDTIAATGDTAAQRSVPFDAPVSTTRGRISVTADQDTSKGTFTRVDEVWPDAVTPAEIPSLVVDFGKVVVRYPEIHFARASDNSPDVRPAFSETLQYVTDRSDADGLTGFRYGLLSKGLNGTSGYGDHAFLSRTGRVTYYNANHVQALKDAANIARLLGRTTNAGRRTARAQDAAAALNTHLWDAAAGAYLDSGTGPIWHGQDANAIAVTAGVTDAARAVSALDHLAATIQRPNGNAFMDNDTLFAGASQRVHAFTSYPELVARFETGKADSAIDQIKRAYGWMDGHDPGITYREGIGPDGSLHEDAHTSTAHGWSTGVLLALTDQLLGVRPTSAGSVTGAMRLVVPDLAPGAHTITTPSGGVDPPW